MSVFTSVSVNQLHELLNKYDLGGLRHYQGIEGGTDNSNYFLDTDQGNYVLTVFERLGHKELPFYLELGDQLASAHCRVAEPVHDKKGNALNGIAGKPAVIFRRLAGRHPVVPSQLQCQQMGKALAEVHLAPMNLTTDIPSNPFGLQWLQAHADYEGWLSAEDKALFLVLLDRFEPLTGAALPTGVIHADLFHDNALFEGDELSGIIDWYFACHDWYLLDLAIMLNDWCRHSNQFDLNRERAMLHAYRHVRPLTTEEAGFLPLMRVLAATRFWLSRTQAVAEHGNQNDAGITVKSPGEMKQLIINLLPQV